MNSFSEQQIRAIIRDEIRQMLGAADKPRDIQFLPTKKAYSALGYDTPTQLRDACRSGLFRQGIEYQDRRDKTSVNRKYYFNIPACIKRLNTPPEKRA